MAKNERYVDMIVRARDEYSRVLNKADRDLKGFEQARTKTQARRDLLAGAKKNIEETRAALQQARKDASDLHEALYRGGKTPADFNIIGGLEQMGEARKKVRDLDEQLRQHIKFLGDVRNENKKGFSAHVARFQAIEKEKTAQRALNDTSGAATSGMNQQGTAADRLAARLKRLGDATRKVKMDQEQLTNSVGAARSRIGSTGGGRRGDWVDGLQNRFNRTFGEEGYGLKPWQMVNLNYQINDIMSGLAMGQNPMQVFAQQIGQVVQLFPGLITGFLRLGPVIAILTPFAVALNRVNREMALLKGFGNRLAIDVDGGNYDPAKLTEMVKEADRTGLAFDEAREAVTRFVELRFDQSQIPDLLDMSRRLAKGLGIELPEAVDKLGEAFSGGVDGVLELDGELNFLTATQYAQVKAMAAQGDAAGALDIALLALQGRLETISVQSEGPWASAIRDLGDAWNQFIDWLADSAVIDGMIRLVTDLGRAAKWTTGILTAVTNNGSQGRAQRYSGASDAKMAAEQARAAQRLSEAVTEQQWDIADNILNVFGYQLRGLRERIDEAQIDKIVTDAVASLPEHLRTADLIADIEDAVRAGRDFERVIEDAADGTRDAADAQKDVTDETEESKKAASDIADSVADAVRGMEEETRLAKLTSKERFIEIRLLAERNKALEKGITLTEIQIAKIREAAGALFDATNVGKIDSGQYAAQYAAGRGTPQGAQMEELVAAVVESAERNNWNPRDILALMSFETGGTLDPWQKGGAVTQHGEHRGLIQWGAPQRAQYGVTADMSIRDQVLAAERYFLDRGVKPGDGAVSLYASVLGGHASKVNASDTHNGGVVSSVQGAVNGKQFAGHFARADGLLEAYRGTAKAAEDTYKANEKAADQAERFHETQNANLEMVRLENEVANKGLVERETALALARAENAAKKAGTTLTEEQRQAIIETTRAKFAGKAADEAATAAKKAQNEEIKKGKALEAEVARLRERKQFLEGQVQHFNETGDRAGAQQAADELTQVNSQLDQAIDKAIAFWAAMGGPEATAAIQKLQQTKTAIAQQGQQSVTTGQQIAQMIGGAASSAFTQFAQAVAQGESPIEALGQAFLAMAADVLLQLGQMIIKATMFKLLMGDNGSGASPGGGLAGLIAKGVNSLFFHGGGIPSRGDGQRRSVSLASLANAPRFHNGTPNRLKPNELVAVLEQDEEVLTSDDPRHADNLRGAAGGGGGGAGAGTTIVNAFDAPSFLESALASELGRDAYFNHVRAHADTYRAILGS